MSRMGIREPANLILVALQVIDISEATIAVEWTAAIAGQGLPLI